MATMKNLQEIVKKFCREHDLDSPVEHRVLDTLSELGELAKVILKMSHYGRTPLQSQHRQELKSELGDVLFSLITVANTMEVDLEEALQEVLNKYERRLRKGSPGSEND